MLSRSSSSSMSRRTYSLSAAARPCSHASCALVLLAIRLTLLFLGSRRGAYTRAAPAESPAEHLQGGLEHLLDAIDEHELEVLPLVFGDLGDITAVPLGHDHPLDPGPFRGQGLLLQAADGQHLAG